MAATKRIAYPVANGSIQVQNANADVHFAFQGGYGLSNVGDTYDNVWNYCPLACTINTLRVDLDTAVLAGSVTMTLVKNGVDTALTVTITSGKTATDSSHPITFAAGDEWAYHWVSSAGATAVAPLGYGAVVTGTNAGEFPGGGNGSTLANTNSATRRYLSIFTPYNGTATIADAQTWVPVACTITKFYTRIVNAVDDIYISLYKNAAEVAASIITILSGNEVGNKTGLSIALAVGDRICFSHLDALDDTVDSHNTRHSVCMVADTDGESWFAGHTTDDLINNGTTEYIQPNCPAVWRTGIRNIHWPDAVTLSKFRMDLTGSPGAGNSYTFTTRKNGASGNEVVAISETAVTGTDATNTDVYAAGDSMNLMSLSASTPTIRDAFWAWKMTTTPVDMPVASSVRLLTLMGVGT